MNPTTPVRPAGLLLRGNMPTEAQQDLVLTQLIRVDVDERTIIRQLTLGPYALMLPGQFVSIHLFPTLPTEPDTGASPMMEAMKGWMTAQIGGLRDTLDELFADPKVDRLPPIAAYVLHNVMKWGPPSNFHGPGYVCRAGQKARLDLVEPIYPPSHWVWLGAEAGVAPTPPLLRGMSS